MSGIKGKKKNRLIIIPEMIPYIMEKYDKYYSGVGDFNIQQVGDELNSLFSNMFDYSYSFNESAYRKTYKSVKDGIKVSLDDNFVDDESKKIDDLIKKLKKERIKLQTEKIEYNKWLREESRDELIEEKIENAISNLKPLEIPKHIKNSKDPNKESNKEFILCFGDEHAGVEFEIKGFLNEVLNSYSPNIFEERMWKLFGGVKEIIKKEKIKDLLIFNLGDNLDGLLRISQLTKLRFGVVDSTLFYADFISNWLNELSKFVDIKLYMVIDSNHSQLRMLGQPKNSFPDENMSKIILSFIKKRSEQNKKIKIIENPTGMIYANVLGYNIVGTHGESKNAEEVMKSFSKIYNINIDYLIGAHYHHSRSETVGVNSEIINIPSIIGLDPYALSIRKSANPGATLLCFEKDKGKILEYHIKL